MESRLRREKDEELGVDDHGVPIEELTHAKKRSNSHNSSSNSSLQQKTNFNDISSLPSESSTASSSSTLTVNVTFVNLTRCLQFEVEKTSAVSQLRTQVNNVCVSYPLHCSHIIFVRNIPSSCYHYSSNIY